jgi:lipid-A-disaccharide synthase
MISAGEASGELYGAMLSRQLKQKWPDIEIFGIGGPRMKEEGVSLLAPISHVLGITEVFNHIFEIRKTFKKAKSALISRKPDVLVLIDYPEFNIALAKKARSAGIPILYYVSPQVWAWRKGRVNKIASLVNKMAVLFPFEVDYYNNTGLECEFVGHPVTENINIRQSKEELKKGLGIDPAKRVITILPGSRPNEINKHLSTIIEVAHTFQINFPDIQVIVPLLSGTGLNIKIPDHIKVVYDRTVEALACSEAAAVASGTATLQTALVRTPMVVFYKVSPLTFFIGKRMSLVRFISLVNILSDKEVVKELLQEDASVANIYSELEKIINDEPYRNEMINSLDEIREIMKDRKPSVRVADMVGEIARW